MTHSPQTGSELWNYFSQKDVPVSARKIYDLVVIDPLVL